jgi:2-C-methyl-D-erythritol 4-phosphate cytidylyltransferase
VSTAGIVVAAGKGERFGGDKALVRLGGRPLWEWARDVLATAGADPVVIVGDIPGAIPGGWRRRDSVRAGLDAVAGTEFVLVHDAARPLASPALVSAVLARLHAGGVDGVIPVVPVRDTLKRIEGDRVASTTDRGDLAAAQTPQGFVTETLRRSHDASDEDATDDAELVERYGGIVVVVAGEERNLKITYAGDLAVAEGLLR